MILAGVHDPETLNKVEEILLMVCTCFMNIVQPYTVNVEICRSQFQKNFRKGRKWNIVKTKVSLLENKGKKQLKNIADVKLVNDKMDESNVQKNNI